MRYHFFSNIGAANVLREQLATALSNDAELLLALDDVPVTVTIKSMLRHDDELVVTTHDTQDGSTILLHIPYSTDPTTAAQAELISYTEGA